MPGYTIRGQRQLESLATQDPSVVMYFAEVPMMRPHGTNGSFFDVQSVQVLKGPQGTLFGRNTTGGAVLLTPNRPDDVFGAELTAGVGNHGAYDTGGYLNLPVGDELAVRFAGQLQHRDGYTHDLHDDKDIDQDDIYAVRVGVLWEPADSIDSYTVYERSKRDQASSGWRLHAVNPAGAYSAFPGTVAALQDTLARLDASDWHTVDNDQVALEQAESWSLSNATSFEYRGLTFKNVLGYRSVETFGRFDYDGSAVTVTGSGTGTVSLFNSQNTLDGDQWSEEFQVLGCLRRSPRLDHRRVLVQGRELRRPALRAVRTPRKRRHGHQREHLAVCPGHLSFRRYRWPVDDRGLSSYLGRSRVDLRESDSGPRRSLHLTAACVMPTDRSWIRAVA